MSNDDHINLANDAELETMNYRIYYASCICLQPHHESKVLLELHSHFSFCLFFKISNTLPHENLMYGNKLTGNSFWELLEPRVFDGRVQEVKWASSQASDISFKSVLKATYVCILKVKYEKYEKYEKFSVNLNFWIEKQSRRHITQSVSNCNHFSHYLLLLFSLHSKLMMIMMLVYNFQTFIWHHFTLTKIKTMNASTIFI